MSKYSPHEDPGRQLPSDGKVGQIAQSLFQLSVAFDARGGAAGDVDEGEGPAVSEKTVNWLVQARRERARYLPTAIFADPMWDMLLHLLQAEARHGRSSVSAVCIESELPEQVALRWVDSMVQNGFVSVNDDPDEAGGHLIELMPAASRALRHYIRDVVESR